MPCLEKVGLVQAHFTEYPNVGDYSSSFYTEQESKREGYPSKTSFKDSKDKETQDKSRNKHREEFSRKKEKYQDIFPKANKSPEKEICLVKEKKIEYSSNFYDHGNGHCISEYPK